MMRFGLGRFYIPRGNRIEGERIFLRPPRGRDWRTWAALREDSRSFLAPWEPTWPADALTHAAYRRRLRQAALEWHEDGGYGFFIFRRSDGALLGGVNISNLRRGVAQAASIGYWIGRAHARQGWMTEALRAVQPFVFERLALNRLEAACLPHNAASRRLLEKVGFREEGYARQYLRIDGAWQDHVLYAMTRSDFTGKPGSGLPAPGA